MNKLITIGVIALVLLGLWFALQPKSPVNAPEDEGTPVATEETQENDQIEASDEESGESSIEVVYTASGYEPDAVTVAVGTTVTFRNESSRLMWTASNPHPVHTTLAAFDALRGVAQGETYSYTFTEAGEWGFHNHLLASQTGVVIVE